MGASARTAWVDVAKGVAIVLVVFNHAVQVMATYGLTVFDWEPVNAVLRLVRMPVFFTVSGLFAASVVARPWRRLWSTRLSLLVWVFLVWTLVRFGYFWAFPGDRRRFQGDLEHLLLSPVQPHSTHWFIHALVLYFVATKLLSIARVPAWAQLATTGAVSMVVLSHPDLWNLSWRSTAQYFAFFLLGMHLREPILRAMRSARWWHTALAAAAFTLAWSAVVDRGLVDWGPAAFSVRLLAVALGFTLAAQLARSVASRPLQYLGRTTLPVYVAHVVVLAGLAVLLRDLELMGVWGPLVGTALAVGISLALYEGLIRTRLGALLYEPPRWFAASGRTAPRGEPRSGLPLSGGPSSS